MWSGAKDIMLTFAPIPSGLLSFSASGTIMYMITFHSSSLEKPFQRIIFGMSLYDLFQSFSAVSSSFALPVGTRWGAIGNQGTCTSQAILTQVSYL